MHAGDAQAGVVEVEYLGQLRGPDEMVVLADRLVGKAVPLPIVAPEEQGRAA